MKAFIETITIIVSLIFCVQACKENTHFKSEECQTGSVGVINYTVNSRYYRTMEKFLVDGHEYLVFGAKLANSPTVVHSESCPCKEYKMTVVEVKRDTIYMHVNDTIYQYKPYITGNKQ